MGAIKHTILFSLFILASCGTKQDTKQIIYPLRECIEVDKLDDYITHAEKIPLITPEGETPIVQISKILLTKRSDFVIQHSGGVALFNTKGEFIRNIGSQGRTKSEYLQLIDIALSPDEDKLYILDLNDRLLSYSMEDGKFISSIQLDGYDNFESIAAIGNDDIIAIRSNPSTIEDFETPFNQLVKFNSAGKEQDTYLPRIDFVFSIAQITRSFDGNYIIRPQEGDNLYYKTTDKGITPITRIDFEDKAAKKRSIFRNGELDMFGYIRSNNYKLPIYLQDTKNMLYFSSIGPEGFANDFIYSFKDKKGIHWKESVSDEPTIIRAGDKEFFYAVYSDYSTSFDLDKINLLKRYIVEKMQVVLNENDNPAIIKFKVNLK